MPADRIKGRKKEGRREQTTIHAPEELTKEPRIIVVQKKDFVMVSTVWGVDAKFPSQEEHILYQTLSSLTTLFAALFGHSLRATRVANP